MTLTEEEKLDAYQTLTFEEEDLSSQEAHWEDDQGNNIDINSVRQDKWNLVPGFGNGDYVGIVNSSKKVVAAKMLKVMAGDRIHAKIDYYSEAEHSYDPDSNPLTDVALSIAGSITNAGAAGFERS